ncbi:hypothetical protein F383_36476 [Gossypium arboreum]|uniref:Uncharacterized protein n=1 Tax=Gossypium arboreum TaxID=29729 RepID=A0A0B0N8Q7_GOSAR|nr:hypothetical protein F383_36476 [Gossypium arboreum]
MPKNPQNWPFSELD